MWEDKVSLPMGGRWQSWDRVRTDHRVCGPDPANTCIHPSLHLPDHTHTASSQSRKQATVETKGSSGGRRAHGSQYTSRGR